MVQSAMYDKDVPVRLAAVSSLAEVKTKRSISALKKALDDDIPEVSFAAAKALLALTIRRESRTAIGTERRNEDVFQLLLQAETGRHADDADSKRHVPLRASARNRIRADSGYWIGLASMQGSYPTLAFPAGPRRRCCSPEIKTRRLSRRCRMLCPIKTGRFERPRFTPSRCAMIQAHQGSQTCCWTIKRRPFACARRPPCCVWQIIRAPSREAPHSSVRGAQNSPRTQWRTPQAQRSPQRRQAWRMESTPGVTLASWVVTNAADVPTIRPPTFAAKLSPCREGMWDTSGEDSSPRN